jgi:acyl-CoA thioesterase YciA
MHDEQPPAGEPAIRVLAMPADTNPNGDIFGGWLMSQMDVAGAVVAIRRANGRVATIAVDAMTFARPVFVGDQVSVYGTIEKVGRTSIAVRVEAFATRGRLGEMVKVTSGLFTYVAIDDQRRPQAVDRQPT